ncbi:hypothetical protein EZY14_008985 [Kordia sp. TARA_039_SRF]|nr:hypothetical protein EZY14_008985 [Kordia sp. TARA_039_SRF]
MKKSIFLFLLSIIVISCATDSTNTQEEVDANYSLISPNNVVLAKSINELNQQITDGKGSITDIEYFNTDKASIIAKIHYTIGSNNFQTLLLRNVYNVKFPQDAIIQLPSKTSQNHDFYVSCSGRTCCAPTGTYDPNTQLFTTACKCDDNDNSSCIMHVSSTPPKGPEIDEN